MSFKTVSSVHSPEQSMAQRTRELEREHWDITAVCLYTHFIIGFSLYLYDHVSTPGWVSVLGVLPFLLLQFFLGKYLHSAGIGKAGYRVISFVFFLIHMMDALFVFTALCAVIRDVMPDHSVFLSSLAVCAFCSYALITGGVHSIPRLARLLPLLVLILFFCCFLFAVPYGNPAHFFPLFGYGASSIGKGALWMCGALSSASWPFLRPGASETQPMSGKPFLRLLFPLLLSALTYCASAWLMPVYTLARPESMGWRLLLVTHMTPSVPAWSMEVLGMFLLLLFSLCVNIWQSSAFFSVFAGEEKGNSRFSALLLFFFLPSCLIEHQALQRFLLFIFPWRGFASLAALASACLIRRRMPSKREAKN